MPPISTICHIAPQAFRPMLTPYGMRHPMRLRGYTPETHVLNRALAESKATYRLSADIIATPSGDDPFSIGLTLELVGRVTIRTTFKGQPHDIEHELAEAIYRHLSGDAA